MHPPSTPPETYDSTTAAAAILGSAHPASPLPSLPSGAFEVLCTPSRSFVAPMLSPAVHRSQPGQLRDSSSPTSPTDRNGFGPTRSLRTASAGHDTSSTASKRRIPHASNRNSPSLRKTYAVVQDTSKLSYDSPRENNPAFSNFVSSLPSPLVATTNLKFPPSPSPRLPPKSPRNPSAKSLSLTSPHLSERVRTPVSDRTATPLNERLAAPVNHGKPSSRPKEAGAEAHWEELDLLGSERVLVSGPERPSVVSTYIFSSPSMPDVFKSRSAKITSPIFPKFAKSTSQKHRLAHNAPELPPDVRVNPLAGDLEGQAALPPGIIPEIVHEVEFGLHYGFEEAVEVELGYRAMRVPLPYAINIRVVETDGEICPASAKLETNPDCPNSMLLSLISGSVNFESDGAGGYEDVVLTFWAAPDTSSVHNTASLLLTVTDVDGTLHETTLELSAEGTEPMIAVERPKVPSRTNRQDTQITFEKDEGTEEEIVTVWNETKHDAPLLINIVVTDSGRDVFSIGRDTDDRCECIPTTIPACSAVSFVVRFERSRIRTLRNFYHGTVLIKLGSMFPKGVRHWKNRDFNLAFDHVLSLQAKGSNSFEDVNTPDTTADLQSMTASETGTYTYSARAQMPLMSHNMRPHPPAEVSANIPQIEDAPVESERAIAELDSDTALRTTSVGSEGGTESVEFEPLDIVVSACGLQPVPDGIDQGPLYEGVFSLLEPVEWALCETSEDSSEDNEVQGNNCSKGYLDDRVTSVPRGAGSAIGVEPAHEHVSVLTTPIGTTRSSASPVPCDGKLKHQQDASRSLTTAGFIATQGNDESETRVPRRQGTRRTDQDGPGTPSWAQTGIEQLESTDLSSAPNKEITPERRSATGQYGHDVTPLPANTPTPYGKLVGYANVRSGLRVCEKTPFGRLVGYSPDVTQLQSQSSVRKLDFGETKGHPSSETVGSVSELYKRALRSKLKTSPEKIDKMRAALFQSASKKHTARTKGQNPVSKPALPLQKAPARRIRSALATKDSVAGESIPIPESLASVEEDERAESRQNEEASGKPPLGPRTASIMTIDRPASREQHSLSAQAGHHSSQGSFCTAIPSTGGRSDSSGREVSGDARPKLRLPRKIHKNGVVLSGGAGSVLLPLCSGSKSDMEVEIQVKPDKYPDASVVVEPSFLVLQSGQRAEVVFNRCSVKEDRMNIFLVCKSLHNSEEVTSYRVPLSVAGTSRRSSSDCFSIDRPTLTFYNPDQTSCSKRIRVFNGTFRRESVHIWLGSTMGNEKKERGGSVFQLLTPAESLVEPQTSLNVDVSFRGWEVTECYYEHLNIKMGNQVETMRVFGYCGGSDIQLEFTKDKVLRARNAGDRYGFVLITGPEHGSEDAFAEKAVLSPGEELEFEMPYGSGSSIFTGDEIARRRFCAALIVDPSQCIDHEDKKEIFSGWFQGQAKAAAAERLDFFDEEKHTLHYASRMFYVGLRQFAFDVDQERVVPVPVLEKGLERNWRASIDQDGLVHISNNDPKESLSYEMEGADPNRGEIPPFGDARSIPYRERITVRSRGSTLELTAPLSMATA